MKRREAQDARARNEKARTLYEIDYLLGVYHESRMGALRFKIDPNGPFLDTMIKILRLPGRQSVIYRKWLHTLKMIHKMMSYANG